MTHGAAAPGRVQQLHQGAGCGPAPTRGPRPRCNQPQQQLQLRVRNHQRHIAECQLARLPLTWEPERRQRTADRDATLVALSWGTSCCRHSRAYHHEPLVSEPSPRSIPDDMTCARGDAPRVCSLVVPTHQLHEFCAPNPLEWLCTSQFSKSSAPQHYTHTLHTPQPAAKPLKHLAHLKK